MPGNTLTVVCEVAVKHTVDNNSFMSQWGHLTSLEPHCKV